MKLLIIWALATLLSESEVTAETKVNEENLQAAGINFVQNTNQQVQEITECVMNKNKLTEIRNQIGNVIAPIPIRCNFVEGNTSLANCAELIKLVECDIEIIRDNMIPLDNMKKLQTAYDELTQKYEETTINASQDYQINLNAIKTELQISNQNLTQAFEELEKLKKITKRICIAEIHSGRIENALDVFRELNDDNQLATIIEEAYNHLSDKNNASNKVNNLENILAFQSRLLNVQQSLIVFQSLYNAMKDNNQLDDPKVLVFYEAFKLFKSSSIQFSIEQETVITTISKNLAIHIVTVWANQGDFDQIIEYADADFISEYLDDFIRITYSLNNFEAILTFIDKFSSRELQMAGYKALIFETKRSSLYNSEITMRLAHKIKTANFPELRQMFPNAIDALIWKETQCRIKSKIYNEYLYAAADNFSYDVERRRVFTWADGTVDETGLWTIRAENGGYRFTIYNELHGEYLYAAAANFAYDKDNYKVFTWRPGTGGPTVYWSLMPNNDNSFTIYNDIYKGALYPASDKLAYDSERRNVFVWVHNKVPNALWEIIC